MSEPSSPKAAPILRSGLILYFVISYAITWSILGLAILADRGILHIPVPVPVFLTVALVGPAVAAVIVTARQSGWPGVRALLARTWLWRVRPAWYAAAIGIPALIMLVAFLLWSALGGPALPAPDTQIWLALPLLIIGLLIPGLLEEIGWRGFALPRMQEGRSAMLAAVVIGLIHAAWHLPIWLLPGQGFDSVPFPAYALLVMGLSVIFTWLYNSTNGSLLIVGLFHASINAFPAPWGSSLLTLPQSARGMNIQIPVAVVVAVCAVVIILLTDRRTLRLR